MEYIESLDEDSKLPGCFLCHYRETPDDAKQRILHRGDRTIVVMNKFPYTNGHLLIAPLAHKAEPEELDEAEFAQLWSMTRSAKMLLDRVLAPHGFNIGVNLGRCAGAGLPGHLHVHVVPRWNGDTNFMAVLGDVRVIPQSLDKLHQALVDAWQPPGPVDPTGLKP
jgi:ATP adenylyltransferase